jgi:hypothetical protein
MPAARKSGAPNQAPRSNNGSVSAEADTKALAEAIAASTIARDDLIDAARQKVAKGYTVNGSDVDEILAGRVGSYHVRNALWAALGGKPGGPDMTRGGAATGQDV